MMIKTFHENRINKTNVFFQYLCLFTKAIHYLQYVVCKICQKEIKFDMYRSCKDQEPPHFQYISAALTMMGGSQVWSHKWSNLNWVWVKAMCGELLVLKLSKLHGCFSGTSVGVGQAGSNLNFCHRFLPAAEFLPVLSRKSL